MTTAAIPWLGILAAQEGDTIRSRFESFIKKTKLSSGERALLRKFAILIDTEVAKIAVPLEHAVEEARLLEVHERLLARGGSIPIEELRKNPDFWSNRFIDSLEDIDRRVKAAFPTAHFERIEALIHG